jgi:hypothetical protein
METNATYLVDEHKAVASDGQHMREGMILYRASDGMSLGMAEKVVVIWGEDINKRTSRLFIDNDHAVKFLLEVVTKADLNKVSIEALRGAAPEGGWLEPIVKWIEKDALIVVPQGSFEIPANGPRPRNYKN